MKDRPLTRDEVTRVIEGQGGARRVPIAIHFWVHPEEFGNSEMAVRALLADYPQDIQAITIRNPEVFAAPIVDPRYRWVQFDNPHGTTAPLDECIAIADWANLDNVLAGFPDPHSPAALPENPTDDGRYRLGFWWRCLFERHWSLRGMTNALMDYYTDPEPVHRLYRALTDFYLVLLERGKCELGLDGVFTSDDIGHQTGPFFSPELFRSFFKPYYREIVERAHDLGMHFWLHACGNIELFLPDLMEIGLDVIHPIQKHTMSEEKIANQFGQQTCIWAGLDVQQVIPWGTPEQVREEVRRVIDTYKRPEGRCMLTAGNAINGDCPVASLEAFLDEAVAYGQKC